MKLLSFICTVKNGERYLDECIQSVVEHYPDAEFVIVDDGSTDGTPAILERWAAAAPQIRMISTGGVGRGAALNMAVEACTRPYIANIDADDIALPGRDVLVDYLEGTDASVAVVAGTSLLLVEGSGQTFEELEKQYRATTSVFIEVGSKLHRGNPISHVGVVMRREALLAVGGYDDKKRTQLDYWMWARLALNGYQLLRSEIPVAVKRLHKDQSFEHGKHLRYVMAVLPIRMAVVPTAYRKILAVIAFIPDLLWAMLPRELRTTMSTTPLIQRLRRRLRGDSGGWM